MEIKMKLKLNKKKIKNLSKDNAILPNDFTPQIGGGLGRTIITKDVFCGATGSCGCDSANRNCTVTNTCK